MPTLDIVSATDATLRRLLEALPVPAEVLLQHTAAGAARRFPEEESARQPRVPTAAY